MPAIKSLLFLIIFITLCFSQTVSISGNITKFVGGDGIGGAVISLGTGKLETESSDDGSFSLTGEITNVKHSTQAGRNAINPVGIFGNNLHLALSSDEFVSITTYSLRGSEIFSASGKWREGTHTMLLPIKSSGIYLSLINVGSQSYVIKTGLADNCALSKSIAANSPVTRSLSASAKAEEFVDTLIISADGFGTIRTIIASTDTNDIEIQMVEDDVEPWIPSGPLEHDGSMVKIKAAGYGFIMGQVMYNAPVHHVSFTRDFWIDTIEVIQADYLELMGETGSFFTDDPENPVDAVTWYNAVRYCNLKSIEEGFDEVYDTVNWRPDYTKNGYRLPSEAEWEYACRAGDTTDFWWGKNYNAYPKTAADTAQIDSCAIWKHNSGDMYGIDDDAFGPQFGASRKPNAYGLYDMAGNVYEFCNDWFENHTAGAQTNPIGSPPTVSKVKKGGSYLDEPGFMRCAFRGGNLPGSSYLNDTGFRLVRNCE